MNAFLKAVILSKREPRRTPGELASKNPEGVSSAMRFQGVL